MGNGTERRRHVRVKIDWPVKVFADHGTVEGEAKNLSSEGIFLCCDEPLRLNETFRMSLSPPNHDAVGLTGMVIWSDLYGLDEKNIPVCMGISFIQVTDKDREVIKELLSIYQK